MSQDVKTVGVSKPCFFFFPSFVFPVCMFLIIQMFVLICFLPTVIKKKFLECTVVRFYVFFAELKKEMEVIIIEREKKCAQLGLK